MQLNKFQIILEVESEPNEDGPEGEDICGLPYTSEPENVAKFIKNWCNKGIGFYIKSYKINEHTKD